MMSLATLVVWAAAAFMGWLGVLGIRAGARYVALARRIAGGRLSDLGSASEGRHVDVEGVAVAPKPGFVAPSDGEACAYLQLSLVYGASVRGTPAAGLGFHEATHGDDLVIACKTGEVRLPVVNAELELDDKHVVTWESAANIPAEVRERLVALGAGDHIEDDRPVIYSEVRIKDGCTLVASGIVHGVEATPGGYREANSRVVLSSGRHADALRASDLSRGAWASRMSSRGAGMFAGSVLFFGMAVFAAWLGHMFLSVGGS